MGENLSIEQQRRQASDFGQLLISLAELFPAVFVVGKYQVHVPLKVGIDHDIAARCPALAVGERLKLLRLYVGRLMYLQALVAGAVRVDLDGNPAGEVTVDEAAHAAVRLANKVARREAAAAAAKAAAAATKAAKAAAAKAAKTAETAKTTETVKPQVAIPEQRRPAAGPNSSRPTLKLPSMRPATPRGAS
jgi:ProP effector